MRAAGADDTLDCAGRWYRYRLVGPRRLRMVECETIEQVGERPADCLPIRRIIVAGMNQGIAQRIEAVRLVLRGQAGAMQQRPQRGIAERGPVELADMLVSTCG